jgi:hypothetical protein
MKPRLLKLFFSLLSLVGWSGCASSAPPVPPSLELPATVSDLRAARKGDRVSLSWTVPALTTDHEAVRHYGHTRICRGAEAALKVCGTAIGSVAPPAVAVQERRSKKAATQKITATYNDTLTGVARPDDEVTYAVEVLNRYGRSGGLSNQVHVPAFPAFPPPSDFQAEITSEGVKFTWSCPAALTRFPDVEYRLRVSRAAQGSPESTAVAEGGLDACHTPLLDQTFEWEKTYQYHAMTVIVVSEPGKPPIEIDGDDTPPVRVVAHDVFPPAVPSDLQAVFSGMGQPPFIDLVWSPDTDADFAGYNVYRHEEGGQPVKLNAELVKAPAYRDSTVRAGKKYFYAVSAVDVRGNESAKSEEASEAVP